jgi:hypothetical protein
MPGDEGDGVSGEYISPSIQSNLSSLSKAGLILIGTVAAVAIVASCY